MTSRLSYGPAFQRLQDIYCNDEGDTAGKLKSFQWITERDTNHFQNHVVHPATLDGVFQLSFAALSKGGREKMPTLIPTRVHRIWLASEGLSHPSSDLLRVYAKTKPERLKKEAFILGVELIREELID